MQKEVSDLKVENQNLKRLLLRQGSSGSADCPFRAGVRSSMSFRERGPSSVRSPDFRLSLTDSSSSLCDLPTTKLSLKYSLTELNSPGIHCCWLLFCSSVYAEKWIIDECHFVTYFQLWYSVNNQPVAFPDMANSASCIYEFVCVSVLAL